MIAPGTVIGPYTVEREIGRGGMGVVFLATDGRLARSVALKSLPLELSSEPDRLSRFEREARVLASVSHPNIAGIHAVEHDGEERRYLVLEHVDGETLADRLERGPLAVDEALAVASSIAAGVAAAHDAGIVHRDLKPANVKVASSGEVKVLDFGIAKALAPDIPSTVTASPTLTVPNTRTGAVVGTAPYMSPEQARGKAMDKRTDVWSFGCILYEMLVGTRAFPGDNAADVLAAIVERDPDWDRLPSNTPYRVRELLKRCLAKEKDRRLRDIGDARIEVELARENREWTTTSLAGQPALAPRRRVAWGWLGLVGLVLLVLGVQLFRGGGARGPEERARPVRFSFDPLEGIADGVAATPRLSDLPAVSPDGSMIAYAADMGGGWGVYVRRLDSLGSEPLRGAEHGWGPFFSPDGRSVGFVSPTDAIMRVSLQGGPAETVGVTSRSFSGGLVWREDGTIVASVDYGSGLWRVPVAGGEMELVLGTDPSSGIGGYEQFVELPGGRGLLFSAWDGATIESFGIFVLETGEERPRLLLSNGAHPTVLEDGYLVFLRDDTLLGVRFDLESLEVVGAPVPVLESVATSIWGGTAHYDLSPEGTLVYRPGERLGAGRHLVFVDTDGRVERITSKPDVFFESGFSASPDGRYLTVGTLRRRYEFWLYDLERQSLVSLDNRGEFHQVAWSRDAGSILYTGFLPDEGYETMAAFHKRLDAPGLGERHSLAGGTSWGLASCTEGRFLFGTDPGEASRNRMLVYDPATGESEPAFESDAIVYQPALSPDGKWLAYVRWRRGDDYDNLFVRAFPDDGRVWQVSYDGIDETPHWSPDGKTLYFARRGTMYAVDVETDPEFRAGARRAVFDWPFPESRPDWDNISMLPSGKFVMIEPAAWEREPARFNVVLNFDEVVREALEGSD